ncbi:hypothetical protein HN51_068690 [Arachis hypogaea]|nr:uncharacterized protein DS421_15g492670 [Arachis hypogaea]
MIRSSVARPPQNSSPSRWQLRCLTTVATSSSHSQKHRSTTATPFPSRFVARLITFLDLKALKLKIKNDFEKM